MSGPAPAGVLVWSDPTDVDCEAPEAAYRVTRADLPPLPPCPCAMCGQSFRPSVAGMPGRPREFCSKECRECSAALTILDRWLTTVAARAVPLAWLTVRGRLFGMSTLRAWNRGVTRRLPT